jgi:pimeloyl-ACP methyl ester carboxylesterase
MPLTSFLPTCCLAVASSWRQSIRALRALLAGAGEAAPYTLIGHSGGGQVAQLFAATFPNVTAGVVLVDAYDNVAQVRAAAGIPLCLVHLSFVVHSTSPMSGSVSTG